MAEYAHLNKAPIVEALVDFRVRPRDGLRVSDLEPIREELRGRYPTQKSIRQVKGQISVNVQDGAVHAVQPAVHSAEVIGIRLESANGLHVLQAQLQGFTLSRLKPYDTWEALIEEARSLWDVYVAVAAPVSVTRVGTRYINRLELPLPMLDFDEYLTRHPDVPVGVPEVISEFLSRVVAYESRLDASIVVTQALETVAPGGNILPMLLDVDVFKLANFDVDSREYWELLAQFRTLKNAAFFGSITEKAKELFI
jgi:uncharacterized protein (TIGR04255 family)